MKENIEKFLKTFKELEKHLRMNSKHFQESEYSTKLNESNNKIIQIKQNRDLLYQAGKLRNILSHNHEVAAPTNQFLNKFVNLVHKIVAPMSAYEIMIKYDNCLVAKPDQRVLDVLIQMKQKRISSVPIVIDRRVIGIFNETSLFHTLLNDNGEMIVDLKEIIFNDHIEDFNLEKKTYFTYQFISRDTDVYQCFQAFESGYKDDEKVELLFVTEKGNRNESLLGLISIFDLINEIQ